MQSSDGTAKYNQRVSFFGTCCFTCDLHGVARGSYPGSCFDSVHRCARARETLIVIGVGLWIYPENDSDGDGPWFWEEILTPMNKIVFGTESTGSNAGNLLTSGGRLVRCRVPSSKRTLANLGTFKISLKQTLRCRISVEG